MVKVKAIEREREQPKEEDGLKEGIIVLGEPKCGEWMDLGF